METNPRSTLCPSAHGELLRTRQWLYLAYNTTTQRTAYVQSCRLKARKSSQGSYIRKGDTCTHTTLQIPSAADEAAGVQGRHTSHM